MKEKSPQKTNKQPGCFFDKEITRRDLIKYGALLGGSPLLLNLVDEAFGLLRSAEASESFEYPFSQAKNVIYSVCLQCHTACPIKVKILNGVAVKIDGNPYSAQNMLPHLKQDTSPDVAVKIDAKLCPKGQAGVQSLYDPYRIVKVLKRNGPRGSNQWKIVPFNQAIDEIVNGGKHFMSIGEDRHVPGLKEIYKLSDAKLAKAMAADAKLTAKKKLTVSDFQKKHQPNLDVLIDPKHPDLGPKNNQFVMLCGRIEHGRKELAKRWLGDSFGSVNFYEHTSICEQSHHIAYEAMTNVYKDGKWAKGKHHMKPDSMNAKFIVFFGTGFAEANFGPPPMAEKVTEGLVTGRLRVVVVDPRLSKSAAKAWKWLPIEPGTDAALALGMISWIIAKGRYDKKYLVAANKAAAKAAGEPTWSNATHLVKIAEDGPAGFVRAKELGIGADEFVVIKDGEPAAVGKDAVTGTLDYSGKINDIELKTSFTILKEEANRKSIADWSKICGIPVADIEAVAKEFTAHGKKAGAELYRGPVQHTNGYYNAQAIISLNILIGNIDHKGGMSVGGGHWHEMGDKLKKPFDLKKMHPGKLSKFGHKLSREKSHYENSTLFNGYPAKRPWIPLSSNIYQEVIPSAEDGYPYNIKALWLHMGSPGYASPAGQTNLKTLTDHDKIPLFFATDIVLGETSMYADYIFPDPSIWERWGSPHTTPDVPAKASKFRQPTVSPLPEEVVVYGEKQPSSFEAVLLAIAQRLNLSGCGKNAFGDGLDLNRAEDWFLKMAANLAWGDKEGQAVPDASAEEVKLFMSARRHLNKTYFDPAKLEKACGKENWLKVIYFLNRGGRWEDWKPEFNKPEGTLVHKFGKQMNLYAENVAKTRHSFTGQRFSGIALYEPIKDAAGKVINDKDFPLALITYKDILGGQSRTLPNNYWLSSILSENYLLINEKTAKKLGFSDGDMAKIVSATNPKGEWELPNRENVPMAGKIKAVGGMRPGVVAVSWHFGHWGYGAADATIDKKKIPGDKRRRAGLCPNAAMRIDPVLKNVCLTDPVGGSSSFFDTRVKLVKT